MAMATRRRYIIEHPTRGVLKNLDETESGNQIGRFTYAGSRMSGMIFGSILSAANARAKVRPFKLQGECQIRQEPTEAEIMAGPFRGDPWKVVA